MTADYSDPAIAQALNEVKSSNDVNWILLGYVPKSDTKLQLVEKGNGGLKAFIDSVSDGKILYSLISFEINKTKKFAYIAWCGEGVTGMKKGLFNNHVNDVGRLFKGFHVQVNARSEADLNEKTIVGKLTKATGASYDSGAKVQGESAPVPTNVREGKVLATASNASVKVADKSDYQKGSESNSFWNKQREEETAAKQSVSRPDKSDYNKKDESAQYWQKQKEEEEAAKREQAARNQANKPAFGGASAARAQFNQPAQTAAPSRPTPPKAAPAPPPPKPAEPEPEPEPEPEQHYEEPQQQYEEPQQHYEEPQQHYEEPQQQYEEPQQEEQPYEEPQQQYEEQQHYEEPQQEEQTYEQPQSAGVATCRALYDFPGENPDDLPFNENDVITVLDKSDPNGWWQGEVHGRVGFFPSNFVEEI